MVFGGLQTLPDSGPVNISTAAISRPPDAVLAQTATTAAILVRCVALHNAQSPVRHACGSVCMSLVYSLLSCQKVTRKQKKVKVLQAEEILRSCMHSAHLYGAAKLPHPDSDVAGDRKSCAAPANAEPKLICISNRDHASAGKRRGQDPRFAA